MARINANLVYPQTGTSLFIRRSPANASEWEVVTGKFSVVDGKRAGFEVEKVLETGIAKGNLARVRAVALHAERKEMAALEAEELATQTA